MRFAAAADSVIPGPGGSGWTAIYAPNGKLSFVSPDGGTTVSSVAKAQQWHKKQVELAAQFQARRAGGTERSLAATAATPGDASTAQPIKLSPSPRQSPIHERMAHNRGETPSPAINTAQHSPEPHTSEDEDAHGGIVEFRSTRPPMEVTRETAE